MEHAEFLISHAARVVQVYKSLQRDLGRDPTFAEYLLQEHSNPKDPGESILILRELWEIIIVTELAAILQGFAAEITQEKVQSVHRKIEEGHVFGRRRPAPE